LKIGQPHTESLLKNRKLDQLGIASLIYIQTDRGLLLIVCIATTWFPDQPIEFWAWLT